MWEECWRWPITSRQPSYYRLVQASTIIGYQSRGKLLLNLDCLKGSLPYYLLMTRRKVVVIQWRIEHLDWVPKLRSPLRGRWVSCASRSDALTRIRYHSWSTPTENTQPEYKCEKPSDKPKGRNDSIKNIYSVFFKNANNCKRQWKAVEISQFKRPWRHDN